MYHTLTAAFLFLFLSLIFNYFIFAHTYFSSSSKMLFILHLGTGALETMERMVAWLQIATTNIVLFFSPCCTCLFNLFIIMQVKLLALCDLFIPYQWVVIFTTAMKFINMLLSNLLHCSRIPPASEFW